ncbi:hypothetical protein BU14_0218s0026 [Porphyra umbilicalis]|uniref:Fatty acid 2-hydroxylase n=1 Tax=Porphyra umbilicalis TaxID=2786 RepID=A0A1X6P534_PORUM|nr:hypothetical protein BU14_0218s0026 [Porphyra umbilicalis]|eukprot:OSX75860.1 hypothetical protein BU14_0218s0026 [Porphyra umbilicalis]
MGSGGGGQARRRGRQGLDGDRDPPPPPPADAEADAYVLTRKLVTQHRTPTHAWVIASGVVYDVTGFLDAHPGGAAALTPHLGGDVTALMGGEGAPHTHSKFAYQTLAKYRVGALAGGDAAGAAVDGAAAAAEADGNVDPATGEALVDWERPLLHQVGLLGDKYDTWIHAFPTADGTVAMFPIPWVEGLTKCPWYVPLLFWLPVLAVEMTRYVRMMGGLAAVDPVSFACWGAAGGAGWLLFEYALHRWVFHAVPTGYWGNILHFLLHGHHHITPMDFDRLVFPPVPAMLVGWPIYFGAPALLGVARGYPWLAGFLIGYLVYDMTHYWIHRSEPSWAWLKAQKRRHTLHHFFNPRVNYGISNGVVDVLLGTLRNPAAKPPRA